VSPNGHSQAKPATTLGGVSQLLEKYKEQIARALPKHLTPERMIRVALTAVSQNRKLLECNALTICGSVVQASILGLEPSSVLGLRGSRLRIRYFPSAVVTSVARR